MSIADAPPEVYQQPQQGACQQKGSNAYGTSPNHRIGIQRGFGKRESSPSPAVRRSSRHTPLLTVRIQLTGEEVEAIVDCAASAPVVGKRLAKKLGVWQRAWKVNVRQGDGSHLSRVNFIVNISFKVYDLVCSTTSPTVLGNFSLDAKVLNIGNEDCIFCLSWLPENSFLVDTQERCLWNAISGLVIPCSVRWIPSVTVSDLDLEPLEDGEIVLIIDASKRYSHYATCFSSQQAPRLPEHEPWDHETPLQDPQAKIRTGAVYKTTWEQDEAFQNYLDENLSTGKFRRSRSATGGPILFERKKDGSLRLVIDFRGLNRVTIANNYLLTIISKLLDKTRAGTWFTRLDLQNRFNLIRVAAGHERNTALRTKKGLFVYTVMPLGLMNAGATFQEMMHIIFKDEEGCVWYMDDILVNGGTTEAEDQAFVEKILQQCVDHGLAGNLTKSEFHVHETIVLSHIVNGSRVQMDPAKLETIPKWAVPTKKKEVQGFLGFANYYRRVI